MNGQTCHQKIIELLKAENDSLRKESIALSVRHTVDTVAKALTDLKCGKENRYVVEFNGNWSITPAGRELPPNFDRTYWEPAKESSGENFASRFLPLELIEKSWHARLILKDPNAFREWKEAESILLPFVLIWMCANKIEPKLEFNSELPEVDMEVDAIVTSLIKLAQSRFK